MTQIGVVSWCRIYQALIVATWVLVAGCLGTTARLSDGAGQQNREFDESTGAIRGIVHDEAFFPLDEVDIVIPELNITAKSGPTGEFTLKAVPPGEHQLFAQKVGYELAARRVAVAVQQISGVSLELKPLPIVEPYYVTKSQQGIFGLGNGIISISSVVSTAINVSSFDTYRLKWQLSGQVSQWKASVFEMEWVSTQALGSTLSVRWEVLDCQSEANSRLVDLAGVSPLKKRINETEIDAFFAHLDASNCGFATQHCNEFFCKTMSRTFGGSSLLVVQQRYTVYLSEFYVDGGDPDFSAISDK